MAAPPTKNLVSRPVTIEAEDGNGNVATQSYSVTAGGAQKTLEYDLNGNLRYEKDSSGTILREFQWDAINRLVKIIDGTQETEFVYDGFDRRVRIIEEENGVELSNNVYLWDGTYIAQRRSADGSTIERSYFSQGFEEGSDDYYTTKDHLGSIREVVASDGTTIEAAYDYSPWGEVTKIGGSGAESDFLYTGHFYHDKSELHLTLYRAYNPELGMWLSRDPIAENGGINLYAYVLNDPVNRWDPLGLWNLWNPLTYGLPTIPGEHPWNPFDSSAEWGATGEGATKGAAAYADGFIPLADPFKDAGMYDECDSGTEYSHFFGQVGRSAALAATGGVVASRLIAASPGAVPFAQAPLTHQMAISNGIGSAVLGTTGVAGQTLGAGLTAAQMGSNVSTGLAGYDLLTDDSASGSGEGCQ